MISLSLIILQYSINILLVILVIAIVGLAFVLYSQLFKPFLELKKSSRIYPPKRGETFEFMVSDNLRNYIFSVGKTTGNIATLLQAVHEDHLVFNIKKNPNAEEYQINVARNGPVLMKPARMATFMKMQSKEKIEGYEIIGKEYFFRLSDKIAKERMTHFLEISMTASFVFLSGGVEKMKFIFKISKIHPGINPNVRNKQGCYSWGKDRSEDSDDSEE